MYKNFFFCFLFMVAPFLSNAQNEHNHAIQFTENKITTRSYIDLLDQKEIKTCQNKKYHYYNKGKIHTTTGGYTGYLLEGRTETTLESGQLLKTGRFKHGLKVGRWEEWNANGTLSNIVRWKDGKKRGTFKQFDDNGHLIAAGKYKQDAYHGKIRQYQNGEVVNTLKYRQGVLKEQKVKKDKKDKKDKKKSKDKSKNKKKKSSKKKKSKKEKKKKND